MPEPLLNTNVAGIPMEGYVMNASGPRCTTYDELSELATASQSCAVVTKSCTRLPRPGNEEPRYTALPLGSIQSMGLPNLGYEEYVGMVPSLRASGKKTWISISGFSIEENVEMIHAFNNTDADWLEINFSCPNIVGKPQLGYDFEQSDNAMAAIRAATSKPLGIKLPPYFDLVMFNHMASLILKHKIDFITCINSLGNTLVIDAEKEAPVIKPKGGFGGLCGQYVKPVGLANVRAFKQRLGDKCSVVGVGGISTGVDAFEYLLAGADAVQVATCYQEEGPGCFARINGELRSILARKEYPDVQAAMGKLKEL